MTLNFNSVYLKTISNGCLYVIAKYVTKYLRKIITTENLLYFDCLYLFKLHKYYYADLISILFIWFKYTTIFKYCLISSKYLSYKVKKWEYFM